MCGDNLWFLYFKAKDKDWIYVGKSKIPSYPTAEDAYKIFKKIGTRK